MNDTLSELQATVAALRAELSETKARLAKLEKVITFEKHENGTRTYIECHNLIVRPMKDTRGIGIDLGTSDGDLPYIHLMTFGDDGLHYAMNLEVQEGGAPCISLRGKDGADRVVLDVNDGNGMVGVMGPEGVPAAVVRSIKGGGSICVTRPDGTPAGLLIHTEKGADPEGTPSEKTQLVFINPQHEPAVRLTTGPDVSVLIMGGAPGEPGTVTLAAQKQEAASIFLRSAGEPVHQAVLTATPHGSRILTYCGEDPRTGGEAGMGTHLLTPEILLRRPDGGKAMEMRSMAEGSSIEVFDDSGGSVFEVSTFPNGLAALDMRGHGGIPFFKLMTSPGHQAVTIQGHHDPSEKFIIAGGETGLSLDLAKNKNTLLHMGFAEDGGIITSLSSDGKGGMATLSGGRYGGGVLLSDADGQHILTLDATDHGGRVHINNDLGLTRISMGVFEESAGIHLNHTGQKGVSIVATPMGGIVATHDAEGNVRQSLPSDTTPDDEDDDDDGDEDGLR